MEFGQKNFFREIDLFDFTSFFGLDFFNFLAHSETIVDKNGSNLEEAATDMVVEEIPKKTEEKNSQENVDPVMITVCENENTV